MPRRFTLGMGLLVAGLLAWGGPPPPADAAESSARKGAKSGDKAPSKPDLVADEEPGAIPVAADRTVTNGMNFPSGSDIPDTWGRRTTWRYGAAWLPLGVRLIRFEPSGVQKDLQELGWAGPGQQLAWGSSKLNDGQLSSTDYGLIYVPAFNTTVLALECAGRWGAANGLYLAHGVQAALYHQPAVAAENGRAVIQTAADVNFGYWAGVGLRGNLGGLGWYAEGAWLMQSAFTPVLNPAQATRVNIVFAHSAPTARVGAILSF